MQFFRTEVDLFVHRLHSAERGAVAESGRPVRHGHRSVFGRLDRPVHGRVSRPAADQGVFRPAGSHRHRAQDHGTMQRAAHSTD